MQVLSFHLQSNPQSGYGKYGLFFKLVFDISGRGFLCKYLPCSYFWTTVILSEYALRWRTCSSSEAMTCSDANGGHVSVLLWHLWFLPSREIHCFFFDGAQAMTVNFFSGRRTFSSASTGRTCKPLYLAPECLWKWWLQHQSKDCKEIQIELFWRCPLLVFLSACSPSQAFLWRSKREYLNPSTRAGAPAVACFLECFFCIISPSVLLQKVLLKQKVDTIAGV